MIAASAAPTMEIGYPSLALGYALLIIPFALMLWHRTPIVGRTIVAIARMTLQLLFVGVYLQFVFKLDSPWLNGAWILVMIGVADFSIIRGCGLRLGRFLVPVFVGLLIGTVVPLLYFLGLMLPQSKLLEARYAIPIGGMILGNCLRADIIGLKSFYDAIRKAEKAFLMALAQGARLSEAVRPFFRDAITAALAPTIATIATIGLVALPGMMTGVILGGANPMTAIKYQIAIMIAIFVGTAITVALAIRLTLNKSFTAYGTLDHAIFTATRKTKLK
ncbi:MAG: ABC transporter permease [Verrucomicrobia bacterium]|nr:ABC transporter permease [Verrucomicrobiota bacterium]